MLKKPFHRIVALYLDEILGHQLSFTLPSLKSPISSAIKCIFNSKLLYCSSKRSMIQEGFEAKKSFHTTVLAWKLWRFSGRDVGKANGGWSSGLFRCVLGRSGEGQSEGYYSETRNCQQK